MKSCEIFLEQALSIAAFIAIGFVIAFILSKLMDKIIELIPKLTIKRDYQLGLSASLSCALVICCVINFQLFKTVHKNDSGIAFYKSQKVVPCDQKVAMKVDHIKNLVCSI